MRQYFILFLKGFGMGAANVIPGVSGGTIALVTGIYEELIESLKSFNLQAFKYLFKLKFNEFSKHINLKFTRAKLEALVERLVERTLEPCKTALKDSGFSAAEINEVVLVGGMTRMPKIVETVKNFFCKYPNKRQRST